MEKEFTDYLFNKSLEIEPRNPKPLPRFVSIHISVFFHIYIFLQLSVSGDVIPTCVTQISFPWGHSGMKCTCDG